MPTQIKFQVGDTVSYQHPDERDLKPVKLLIIELGERIIVSPEHSIMTWAADGPDVLDHFKLIHRPDKKG